MLLTNLSHLKIILGSGSPRRRELLTQMGLKFELYKKEVDESFPEDIPFTSVASYLAQKKANAYNPDDKELVITADTTVVCKERILGKPKNRVEAIEILTFLSNQSHEVTSACCLKSGKYYEVIENTTVVSFANLHRDEIEYYVDQYQPFDKAGAYGIQEYLGLIGIKKISGSFYTVMGLPVYELYQTLKSLKI